MLNARLDRLADDGLLGKRRYRKRPERCEYRPTEMAGDLWPAIVAVMEFGDKHLAGEGGPPRLIQHRDCGGTVDATRRCQTCGVEDLGVRDVASVPGPGSRASPSV